MKALTFILLVVFTMTAYAQKSPVEKFIEKNAYEKGITMKEILPGSTEFTGELKLQGDDIKQALEQIEIIQVIRCETEKTSSKTRNEFYSKAMAALTDDSYISMMSVKTDDGDNVGFYANQKEDGKLNEVILMVKEKDEVMMAYVKGDIDLSFFLSQEFFSSLSNCDKNSEKD